MITTHICYVGLYLLVISPFPVLDAYQHIKLNLVSIFIVKVVTYLNMRKHTTYD